MAKIQSETRRNKHRNACFLCCFGVSRPEKSKTVARPDNKKSWFRLKKSPSKRTIPVYGDAEKTKASDQAQEEIQILQETRRPRDRNTARENRNSFDHVDSPSRKRLKVDAIKTGFIQPGSPDFRPTYGRTRTVKLSKSVSLPAPTREKRGNPPSGGTTRRGKHDPVVGLSILVVTLVIFLIWGRTCAILCTSAWFYFLPRFGTSSSTDENMVESPESDSGDPDLNAKEHKKRVVMEGFLERNYHSSAL